MAKPDWEAIETAYRAGVMSLVKLRHIMVLVKVLSASAQSVMTGPVILTPGFSKRLTIWYANRKYAKRYAPKLNLQNVY